jgi:hypothetical protein
VVTSLTEGNSLVSNIQSRSLIEKQVSLKNDDLSKAEPVLCALLTQFETPLNRNIPDQISNKSPATIG